jgi:hypothetical protein
VRASGLRLDVGAGRGFPGIRIRHGQPSIDGGCGQTGTTDMELREIVRMLYQLRALRDRYPSASLRIAVVSGIGLAAYLMARLSR